MRLGCARCETFGFYTSIMMADDEMRSFQHVEVDRALYPLHHDAYCVRAIEVVVDDPDSLTGKG
jgi:hypothetical protein